ncbi:hypothetical protein T265_10452 [Opisthorchis viverrini]|uniref:G-protein coupled receptors family 2 profile 2 domain-containing protein n=1 Tax=Opisthorchis viverrini TaxID=6198 RepID=A0A074Z2A7_OPIVI|nr:hypothetical protein T265_10452 [Opisthorchis viverrini]KER21156.1 hypothetical protein T265_10452 [Opisthorchis viverrini]
MSTHNSSDSSSFFEWDDYLSRTGARPADPKCFKQAPYSNSRGRVKVYGELSSEFTTSSGVRQGCPLSPFLFNFVIDTIMEDSLPASNACGVEALPGPPPTDIEYADDIALLGSDPVSRIPPQNLFEVNALLEAEDQRSAAHDVQTTSPFTPDSFKSSTTGSTGVGSGANRRSSLAANPVGTLRRFRAAAFSLAQVVEVWGPRLRIRLIGTDDRNDCWFLVDSDQIRPYPSGEPLQPPFGYMYNHLNWSRTLKSATEGAKFADPSWFVESPSDPTDNFFRVGDKLEAVDRHNSQLICPATIGAVNGQHIFVSFDGWSGAFDYWTRFDSRELFPVGWCKLADYPLQSPGPNALRSPTNQSTPAPARPLTSSRPDPLNTSSETPSLSGSAKRPIGTKRLEKRNRSHAAKRGGRPNSRRRVKTSALRRQPISAIVHKPVVKPEVPASDTVWPSETVKRLTSVSSHPELTDSADSSMRSMSSPPTIHPMNEDASESVLNLSVSSSDQPPAIEVALPIQSDPPRVRRISNSSDCVVRLQAKSPPVPSDRADYTKPEHKSWQVVPISPQSQRKAPKRHRHSVDKASRLRKKFKLVGTSERPTFTTLKGELNKHSTSKETIPTLRQDEHSNKTKPEVPPRDDATSQRSTSPSSLPLPSLQNSHSTHFRSDRSGQTPLHLYCGDYNATSLASYETKPVTYLPPQSESASSGEHLDDDVASSVTRSNGVAPSYTSGLWYPSSRMEYNSSKMLDAHAASSHATDDYSDGQSLAPHVSSSTVSPSSLDLGPGPLPNPALWTIDEVYHYLTTRDPSLLEVAQKFKHHDFANKVAGVTVEPDDILISFDVNSLYTNVPKGDSLEIDKRLLLAGTTLSERTQLTVDEIVEGIKACLNLTHFVFDNVVYTQEQGLAMGSPISPVLANIFMEEFEQIALTGFPYPPKIFWRYVDDTFVVMKRDNVREFYNYLKELSPQIKFSMELESTSGKLAFLDCMAHKVGGKLKTAVYEKPTDTGAVLNYSSVHPKSVFASIASSMFRHARALCTEEADRTAAQIEANFTNGTCLIYYTSGRSAGDDTALTNDEGYYRVTGSVISERITKYECFATIRETVHLFTVKSKPDTNECSEARNRGLQLCQSSACIDQSPGYMCADADYVDTQTCSERQQSFTAQGLELNEVTSLTKIANSNSGGLSNNYSLTIKLIDQFNIRDELLHRNNIDSRENHPNASNPEFKIRIFSPQSTYNYMSLSDCHVKKCVQAANLGVQLCDTGVSDCETTNDTYRCRRGVPLLDVCNSMNNAINMSCPQLSHGSPDIEKLGSTLYRLAYNAKSLHDLDPEYLTNLSSKMTDQQIQRELDSQSDLERHQMAKQLLDTFISTVHTPTQSTETNISMHLPEPRAPEPIKSVSNITPSTSPTKKINMATSVLHIIASIVRKSPHTRQMIDSGQANREGFKFLRLNKAKVSAHFNKSDGAPAGVMILSDSVDSAFDSIVAVIPSGEVKSQTPEETLKPKEEGPPLTVENAEVASDVILVDTLDPNRCFQTHQTCISSNIYGHGEILAVFFKHTTIQFIIQLNSTHVLEVYFPSPPRGRFPLDKNSAELFIQTDHQLLCYFSSLFPLDSAFDSIVAVIPSAEVKSQTPEETLKPKEEGPPLTVENAEVASDVILVDTLDPNLTYEYTLHMLTGHQSYRLSDNPDPSSLRRGDGRGTWSSEDCQTVVVGQQLQCRCTPRQTGTFAIALVYWLGDPNIEIENKWLVETVSYVFTAITVVALILFLIFTRFIGVFRLDQFNIAFSLLLTSIAALISPLLNDSQPIACTIVAIAVCFFLLAAFSWKFIFGLNTLMLIVAPHSRYHELISRHQNCIPLVWIGYLIPAVIVGAWFGYAGAVSSNLGCFGPSIARWVLVGFITIVVIFNFFVLLIVGVVLLRSYLLTRKSRINKSTHFLVLTQLMLTLGLPYTIIYMQFVDHQAMLFTVPIALGTTAVLMFLLVAVIDEENRHRLESFLRAHFTRTTSVPGNHTTTAGQVNRRGSTPKTDSQHTRKRLGSKQWSYREKNYTAGGNGEAAQNLKSNKYAHSETTNSDLKFEPGWLHRFPATAQLPEGDSVVVSEDSLNTVAFNRMAQTTAPRTSGESYRSGTHASPVTSETNIDDACFSPDTTNSRGPLTFNGNNGVINGQTMRRL